MRGRLFLPSLALCALSTACSVSHDAAEQPTKTSEQALQSSAKLGWGYDEELHQEKDKACIYNYRERLRLVSNRSMRAFQTYQQDEISLKVNASLDVDADFSVVSGTLKTKLNEYYNSNSSRAVLGVVVYVHSATRVLDKYGSGGPPPVDDNGPFANQPRPYCDISNPSTQMEDLREFLNVCGDRYVSEQKLGGFITLLVDVSNLERKDRLELEATFDVGAKEIFTGNVNGAFSHIATFSSALQDLKFEVDAYGIPTPDTSLLTGGKLTAGQWFNYMQQVEASYTDAYDQWNAQQTTEHAYDSGLGVPIEQSYKPYDVLDLRACSRNGQGFGLAIEQLLCYQNFWTDDSRAYSDQKFSDLRREIEDKRWSLDHAHKVKWKRPIAEHQAEFQAVIRQYDQCLLSRPATRTECAEARDNGQLEELCDLCRRAEECEAEAIKSMLDKLTEAPIKVADPKPVPLPPVVSNPRAPLLDPTFHFLNQNKDSSIGNVTSEICVWSGLSGRMSGGGEGVKVYIDPSNYWSMKTWSANNKHIRSEAICMPKQNFYGGASDFWQNEHIDEWSTNNTVTSFSMSYDVDTLFALSGISGKMQGSGESADLTRHHPANPTYGQVASRQGHLRAWTTAFGLEDPLNNRPRFFHKTYEVDTYSGDLEKQMSPSDETLCYLKRIAGDFDGAAERVEIVERDGHWFLRAEATPTILVGKYLRQVRAKAECIYFDQSRL